MATALKVLFAAVAAVPSFLIAADDAYRWAEDRRPPWRSLTAAFAWLFVFWPRRRGGGVALGVGPRALEKREKFEAFYRSELAPFIKGFERLRRPLAVLVGAADVLAFGGFVLSVLSFASEHGIGGRLTGVRVIPGLLSRVEPVAWLWPLWLLSAPSALGVSLYGRVRWRRLAGDYKREVVGKIVEFVAPGFSYRPDEGMRRQQFVASRIFRDRPGDGCDFRTEDALVGVLAGMKTRLCEVHAAYEEETRVRRSDGRGYKTRTKTVPIFDGIFACADLPRPVRTPIRVVTDGPWEWLRAADDSPEDGPKVPFGDPDFEAAFTVYSADAEEAVRVLAPSFRRHIMEFVWASGKDVQLSFVGGVCNVAIPFDGELFEPRLFRTTADPRLIRAHFDTLLSCLTLLDGLSLADLGLPEPRPPSDSS